MKLLPALFFVSLLVSGCNSSNISVRDMTRNSDPEPNFEQSLPEPTGDANAVVQEGVAHELDDGSIILPIDVSDSRCTEVCVWEGELSATIEWSSRGVTETIELLWAYHADPTRTPDDRFVISLWDADVLDDGTAYVHLEIRPAE